VERTVSAPQRYRSGAYGAMVADDNGPWVRWSDAWQPIESAPKDGTVVDVWLGDADDEDVEFYCTPGTRRSCGWAWKLDKFRPVAGLHVLVVTVRPTHWMPLPEPPK
jgi:hypothetical protein